METTAEFPKVHASRSKITNLLESQRIAANLMSWHVSRPAGPFLDFRTRLVELHNLKQCPYYVVRCPHQMAWKRPSLSCRPTHWTSFRAIVYLDHTGTQCGVALNAHALPHLTLVGTGATPTQRIYIENGRSSMEWKTTHLPITWRLGRNRSLHLPCDSVSSTGATGRSGLMNAPRDEMKLEEESL